MQSQLIQLLTTEVIPEANATQDPEGSLLKSANAHNLPPAALERLGQLWNAGRTLNHFQKQADRAATIPLVDIEQLLSTYSAFKPEIKEAAIGQVFVEPFPPKYGKGELLKSAAASKEEEVVIGTADLIHQAMDTRRTIKLADEYIRSEKVELEEAIRAVGSKLASTFGENGLFQKRASDILCRYGEGARPVLSYIASQLGSVVRQTRQSFDMEKISAGNPRLIRSDTVTDSYERITEALDCIKTAHAWREEQARLVDELLEKVSGYVDPITAMGTTTDESGNRTTLGESLDKKKKDTSGSVDPLGFASLDWSGASDLKRDLAKSIGVLAHQNVVGRSPLDATLARFLGTPEVNKDQIYINDAGLNTRRRAVLQELMLNDEVLAEEDPDVLESYYETLLNNAPGMLDDPTMLAFTLRHMIERGGLDPLSMRNFSETDEQLANARRNRENEVGKSNTPKNYGKADSDPGEKKDRK